MKQLLVLSFLISYYLGQAQDLAFYADVMINASSSDHRLYAAEQFEKLFLEDLSKPNSFNNSYENLEWISFQYPENKSFRIISWQIQESEDKYSYRTIYQDKNKTVVNDDNESISLPSEYGIVNWEEWAGGLVYRIVENKEGYQIFTFRYIDQYTKLKTCEVINTKDGLSLGKSVFQEKEDSENYKDRLVLTYSSDTNCTLSIDPTTNRVVYDNLISVMGRLPGQGPTQVPDGSYKAYEWTGKKYKAIDKLFTQTMDAPPRQSRQNGDKDLFGRSKGN